MPKLTPAQQTIVDKMANGAELVYSLSPLECEWFLSGLCADDRRMDFIALRDAGCIQSEPIPPMRKRYTLTELGLSLARKDGWNELPKM